MSNREEGRETVLFRLGMNHTYVQTEQLKPSKQEDVSFSQVETVACFLSIHHFLSLTRNKTV